MIDNIRMADERILLKPLTREATTPGGIVLPDCTQEKPTRGVVVATGDKTGVNVGEVVAFSPYQYAEQTLNGEVHIVIKSDAVLFAIGSAHKRKPVKKAGKAKRGAR